jgi:pyruvate kinase
MANQRRTKIICTLGDEPDLVEKITGLYKAGADGFRLCDRFIDMSTEQKFRKIVESVR